MKRNTNYLLWRHAVLSGKIHWTPEIQGDAIILTYTLFGTATILRKTLTTEAFSSVNEITFKKPYPTLYKDTCLASLSLGAPSITWKRSGTYFQEAEAHVFSEKKKTQKISYCCCKVPSDTGKCNSKHFLKNSDT